METVTENEKKATPLLSNKSADIVLQFIKDLPPDECRKFELEPYNSFCVERTMPPNVDLGFWIEMGGDLCPDPQIHLKRSGSSFTIICVDTMFACEAGGKPETLEYVEEFLDEMARRYLPRAEASS